MTRFVIVGVQRTGTTLVRTTLDSHPDILCLGEVFVAAAGPFIRKERRSLDVLWERDDLGYRKYVTDSILRRIGHIAWRKWLVTSYLDWLYDRNEPAAVGFKFMLNHMRGFPSVVPYLREHGIHAIHVVRENSFDIYLSRLTMKARGLSHSSMDGVQQVQVMMPTRDLIEELDAIREASERWSKILGNDNPYLRVTYEDFVRDRDTEMDKVADFLGVEKGYQLESGLRKLNTASLREIIVNFDDVLRCLENSEYAWCIAGRI